MNCEAGQNGFQHDSWNCKRSEVLFAGAIDYEA